jgi:hypothetical protein
MDKKENSYYSRPVQGLGGAGPDGGQVFGREKRVDFLFPGLLTCGHVSGAFSSFRKNISMF